MTKANKNRIETSYSMIDTDIEKEKNAMTINIYRSLVKCTGKNYTDLISTMSKISGKNVDIEFLKNSIIMMKKINTRNAEEMTLIIKLAIAISKKDKNEILLNRVALAKIQNTNSSIKDMIESNNDKFSNKSANLRKEHVKEISNKLKSISEEGKITEENKLTNSDKFKLRKYISDFDKEQYLDYILLSNPELEKISLKEVDEIIYLLTFFINNLYANIFCRSFNLGLFSDIKKSPNIKLTGDALMEWKYNRARKLLNIYIKYRKLLLQIRDEKVLEINKELSDNDKRILKEEDDFLYDYYKKIKRIINIKKNVVERISVNEENKKQYIKMFTNKVIVDDKNNE